MVSEAERAFMDATGASAAQAQRYLQAYAQDANAAVVAYFQGQGAPASSRGTQALHRAPRHRFSTFSDLQKQEEDNKLFTGGEKSALAVQDPNDRNRRRGLVDQILSKARQGPPPEELDSAEPEHASQFHGRGFKLGSEAEPGEEIVEDEDDDGEASLERVKRLLIFWRNGFSVENGEFYSFSDPENQGYLRAINMGRAPVGLLNVRPNQMVDVQIEQRPNEDFIPEKPVFSGEGQRLGIPVSTSHQATPQPEENVASTSAQPTTLPSEDEGDTQVQVRLANGTAHRRSFQSDGPVQQLYDFADTFSNGRRYILQLPFPRKDLNDHTQSLKDAGVAGAAIVQRWL